ncbi:MAG: hypothetical protein Q8M15_16650 [Bacteroidota bacterium]|nr:hypothetical protein [Bacteroidota bacterium]
MNFKRFVLIVLLMFSLLLASMPAKAQCAMCKTNVENARKEGHTLVGSTLNNGIMYLLFLPYAIAGVFGYIYYKKYKEKQAADRLKGLS